MTIEPKRVKKIDSPLLIIGLGGTGSDALLTIMDKFNRRYELPITANGDIIDTPERTAYLAFDTDILDLQGKRMGNMSFQPGNIFQLVIPAKLGVGALPEYILDWWDTALTGYEIRNGCGGIRQAGRFVHFYNADSIEAKLRTVIHTLLATPTGGNMGTLEIVMTTGISGGTGSGSFLDMAYLIRYIMNNSYPMVSYNFMAYIMMPPVNVDKIPNITTHKQSMLESTGFAALKELDFWMNYATHKYPFEQRYSENLSIPWNSTPFDYAILMSNAKLSGGIVTNAYEKCMDELSESVVNFYAHETVGINGQISLRSHLSNVTQQKQFLIKPFPANYTYMTVGAAVSDSEQDVMVTYESKLTYDRILDLRKIDKLLTPNSRHAAPLLGKHEGEEFMDLFLPKDTDYFSSFAAIMPELGIFSDPSWTPQTFHDSPAVHDGYYHDWCHECSLQAEKFASAQVKILYERFRNMVKDYCTNLTYGPYTVSAFLKDANNGFIWFVDGLVENWGNLEHSIESERNNTYADVSTFLYVKMMEINKVAILAGLWGPAKKYSEGCQRLFRAERDYELAKALSKEMKDMRSAINAYSKTILPAFCDLLGTAAASVNDNMQSISAAGNVNSIATTAQLKQYIDSAFGNTQQDEMAVRLLTRMIDLSQSITLDNLGTPVGMADARESFMNAADEFVKDGTSAVNGINMDQLLTIMLPQATQQTKINQVAQVILPNLKQAAETMLPLLVTNEAANQYIPYAYVSIPNNAPTIDAGVQLFSQTYHITPKRSDVSDRIYWLNTFNCVPMYMYTDLQKLESVYTTASENGVHGLHLVHAGNEDGNHVLRHDWSLLPSPVVHKLEDIEPPKNVRMKQEEIRVMFEQAMTNGAATLSTTPNGLEQLDIRLRMHNGRPETMDQFEKKLSGIVDDATLIPEAKIQMLIELSNEGTVISKEYPSYTQVFADAARLRLSIGAGTDDDLNQIAENRETARRMAAEYILYAWYPHIADQMIAQKEMFRKLGEAIEKQQSIIAQGSMLKTFAKSFLILYLNDTFVFGRTNVKYKDFRGEETVLFSKADLTDDELTIYRDFCPPLVILSMLGTASDDRINSHDRQYLNDEADKLAKSTDNMSDEQYEAIRAKAKSFQEEFARTDDAIKYDKGAMPKPVREKMIELLKLLMSAARIY